MTDVYISFAREDQERVRPLAEALQLEGWDVWWDPSGRDGDSHASLEQKLGSAGAILVVWSAYARGSEYVRSEAATGLYKNKLIQTRVDSAAPPRPFDQVEVTDLSLWSGDREDPSWRRVVQAVRLFAGAPGMRPSAAKPQRVKKQPAMAAPPPPQADFTATVSKPDFLERERSIAWAPIAAAGVLVMAGVGIWFVDPFGWRGSKASEPAEEAVVASTADPAAADAVVAGEFQDNEASEAAWGQVDRTQAASLREHVTAFPRTSTAETARSLLRVLDAQAWVDAVTADNEIAYTSYLKNFPDDGVAPGMMAAAARDRLASLTQERLLAIEEIQRGLQALELYNGKIDGKAASGTVAAIRQFASLKRKPAPQLSSAAPRDLRAFSDLIQKQALAEGKTIAPPTILASAPAPAAAKAPADPIIAAATVAPQPSTTARSPAAAPPPAASTNANAAAEAADRLRREQAQAAIAAARKEATTPAADDASSDAKRTPEQIAWESAENTGTLAAYQTYLSRYPSGARAADARAAVTRLNRTAAAPSASVAPAASTTAFSTEALSAEVKLAVDTARRAQSTANSRASAARDTAAQASTASGRLPTSAPNGDRYETQISGGAPNGLGTRTSGAGRTSGDRYRGEIRNGQAAGLGVYEYSANAGNPRNMARYEGEHAGDQPSGYGVTTWKNGDSFAGVDAGSGAARGVMNMANGQRYEGEMRNGQRSGIGVVWSADGQVVQAGRWENGQLVQPMGQQ